MGFVFPIQQTLESERVILETWTPDHARSWANATQNTPQLFNYLPFGPFDDASSAASALSRWATDESKYLYAVFAKPGVVDKDGKLVESDANGRGCLAGTIGLLNSVYGDAMTEIGHVVFLPRWQRTCVATHANGLLLQQLLDPLPPFGNGLGLRRVQWQCHSDNAASRIAAERLGFAYEGTHHWCRVLPPNKPGSEMPSNGRMFGEEQRGRHSCMLALCWDDWEKGQREHITMLMNR